MKITRNWKLAAGCAILAISACTAFAQAPDAQAGQAGPPPGRGRFAPDPERELKMLTERLSLTADQQTGVKAILEQQTTQMKALRAKTETADASADTPEARTARMTQMTQIREESDTKINALLDDTQKKTYAEIIARRKARMAQGGGPGGPPPAAPPQ